MGSENVIALDGGGGRPAARTGRRNKLRSVWISFTGRILSQLVGATATVTLGVLVLHQGRVQDARASVEAAALEPVVAVLPFANLSGDSAKAYLADGATDALIARLSQSCGVRVVSRTSSMAYRDTGKTVRAIARELGVDYLVEGAVMRSGDRVRLSTQVVEAATDTVVWGNQIEERISDPLAMHDAAARATTSRLLGVVSPARPAAAVPDCLAGPRT